MARRASTSRLRRPTSKLRATAADPRATSYPSGELPLVPATPKRRRRRLHPNSTAATVWGASHWTFRT